MSAPHAPHLPALHDPASAGPVVPLIGTWWVRSSVAGAAGALSRWADDAGLALLVLAVLALLCRPADLYPALEGTPLYEGLMVACLALSLPRIWECVRVRSLAANPAVCLALLLVPAVVLSHLSHGDTYDARLGAAEMSKASAFLLLVMAQCRTAARVRMVLGAVLAGVVVVAALALLQYYGAIDLPAITAVEQQGEPGSAALIRLCGVGIFNDPNDFALIVVIAGVVGAYALGEKRFGRWRWSLLVPVAVLAHAFLLTHSRGGFMAAGAGTVAFLIARFGWRNALPIVIVLVPVALAPMWGRQTSVSLDDPDDTFQTRVELWRGSLEAFRTSPLFGVGQGKLTDLIGQVAHNSYLHAFAELGLAGGAIFVGAVALVIRGLWRARPSEGEAHRMRPYMLAIVVSYAVGLLSLSRCYTVPTQLVLGLGAAYLEVGVQACAGPRMDWRCTRWVFLLALGMLGATWLFVRAVTQTEAP